MSFTPPPSKNSHIVEIRRRMTFLQTAQMASAPEFVTNSKQYIGSYWVTSLKAVHGSGLSQDEIKLLLPHLIDSDPKDRDFREKVANYYLSFKTSVPYEGLKLEIGLEEDNDKPLSESNMPLDIHDFVKYRHAIGHPQVAMTEKEAAGNPLKSFYVFDKKLTEDLGAKASKERDKALETYLATKNDPDKVDMLLTLLSVDPTTFKGANRESLKADRLHKIATETPASFLAAVGEKNFEERYTILTALNLRLLNKTGTTIFEPINQEVWGDSIEQAVVYMKSPKNSGRVVILKQQMQEKLKGLGNPISQRVNGHTEPVKELEKVPTQIPASTLPNTAPPGTNLPPALGDVIPDADPTKTQAEKAGETTTNKATKA